MRITRIYHPGKLTSGATLQLMPSTSHHLLRVLRCKPGDKIILFNGEGGEFSGQLIESPNAKYACVTLENFANISRESPLQIHLLQGISRGEKMDFTIQKAVELGVTQITPVFTEFGNVKLNEERGEKKLQRWQQIIINACEQSGRTKIPILNASKNFPQAVAECKEAYKFILHPGVNKHLKEIAASPSMLALLVGTEGGFSETEISIAMQQQFILLQLGPRILRTETAGLAAIAILQSRWGDLS